MYDAKNLRVSQDKSSFFYFDDYWGVRNKNSTFIPTLQFPVYYQQHCVPPGLQNRKQVYIPNLQLPVYYHHQGSPPGFEIKSPTIQSPRSEIISPRSDLNVNAGIYSPRSECSSKDDETETFFNLSDSSDCELETPKSSPRSPRKVKIYYNKKYNSIPSSKKK